MKELLKITLLIAVISLFASCESGTNSKQILSKPDTRKEMMDKIANDSSMSMEMIAAMMTSNNGMAMMQSHESMLKMMNDNPGMMQSIMSDMMDMCKNDSTMMANPQLIDMMQKMKDKNMDMGKMNGMNTVMDTDHKAHH